MIKLIENSIGKSTTKSAGSNTVSSKDKVKLAGKIKKILPGSEYLVEVQINDRTYELIGYISGKMRKNYIKLAEEDLVDVEITPYDITKCRIVYRRRNNTAAQPMEAAA